MVWDTLVLWDNVGAGMRGDVWSQTWCKSGHFTDLTRRRWVERGSASVVYVAFERANPWGIGTRAHRLAGGVTNGVSYA